jgi:hypothetical protein
MATEQRTLTADQVEHLIRIGSTSLEGQAACGCGTCCKLTRAVLSRLLALRGIAVATLDLSQSRISIWARKRRGRKAL